MKMRSLTILTAAGLTRACCASSVLEREDHSLNSTGIDTSQLSEEQPPNGGWLGWGADVYNNRWAAPDARINVGNAASLNLTCSLFYSPGVSANPYVDGDTVYYPAWSGLMVALKYKTCQIVWQADISDIIDKFKPVTHPNITAVASRTTPVINGDVIYIGTLANALLIALDKKTGDTIDLLQINDHPFAILTMSPTVWKGILNIGVSSNEDVAAALVPGYHCCSFIGSMNAFTLIDGQLHLHWTQSMLPPNNNFSGPGIWGSQPSIDTSRNQVFVATG